MSLLEDNLFKKDDITIERFEQTLVKLLEAHTSYQKQIIQLKEENKALKSLLEASKTHLNASTIANKTTPVNGHLVHQINKYVKEIDLCLAYFEQV